MSIPRRQPRQSRRCVLYILLGFLTFNVLALIFRETWRPYSPVFYSDRVAYCSEQSWDMVVIGGSPAMGGIDVDLLTGLSWNGERMERSINLGLPLATTSEVWHSVKHGLPTPPRLLIYGIAITDLNGNRCEPQGPRDLMNLRDLCTWIADRPEDGEWAVRHFADARMKRALPLVWQHEALRFWAADGMPALGSVLLSAKTDAQEKREAFARLRTERGFVAEQPVSPLSRYSYRKATNAIPPFHYLQNYDVRKQLPALERLIAWAEEHQVSLVLVSMPFTADVGPESYPAEWQVFQDLLESIRKSGRAYVFLMSLEELGLTDEHFMDQPHLNGDGVQRFTTWLRHQLESRE